MRHPVDKKRRHQKQSTANVHPSEQPPFCPFSVRLENSSPSFALSTKRTDRHCLPLTGIRRLTNNPEHPQTSTYMCSIQARDPQKDRIKLSDREEKNISDQNITYRI